MKYLPPHVEHCVNKFVAGGIKILVVIVLEFNCAICTYCK